jgi:hypothetical protein
MRGTVNFGRRVWRAVLLASVFGGLCVAGAGAKTVRVGQLFTPTGSCSGTPNTVLQTGVASGTSYTVRKAGVITSWSFEDGAIPLSVLKLKVGRRAGAGMYKIVAEAAAGSQLANSVNTYSAHIPVKAGDVIGLLAGDGNCGSGTGNSSDVAAVAAGDVPPGTTAPFISAPGAKFPISAKVALDCVVPHLKGKTLKAAKKALKAHSCKLGRVTGKGRRVKRQRPRAGKTLKPGARVNVRLG